MNCNSSHSLFLRSNGILVCWDDFGSSKELQAFERDIDYASDVYLGSIFDQIRSKLASEEMPFPEHCSKCFCLMTQMPMDDRHYAREKAIDVFQIEPSMGCQLECPGCIPKAEREARVRKTDHGQMTLDPLVLYKIVADLYRADIKVKKFDMQGHGEPTLHKELWKMCGFISNLYPDSVISVCTHANLPFRNSMVHSGVNEMIFAIDGVDQSSYSPYRVDGNFDSAYAFMRDFSITADSEAPYIDRIWKYVVFNHNDSKEQLLRAQEMALEAKIKSIRFVLTQLGPASGRVNDATDIPILDKSLNVVVDSYRIKVDQLVSALTNLEEAIYLGDNRLIRSWSEYISTSIYRLFRTAPEIPASYKNVVANFRKLIRDLPAEQVGQQLLLLLDTTAKGKTVAFKITKSGKSRRPGSPLPLARTTTAQEAANILSTVDVDEDWYVSEYPDIADAIQNKSLNSARDHFVNCGYFEDRLPFLPKIDEEFYTSYYPDVEAAVLRGDFLSGTDHYVKYGHREGRLCFPKGLSK